MKLLSNAAILTMIGCLIFVLIVSQPSVTSADPADNLVISGLVSNVLNFTYTEIESMPMFWEVTNLQCVGFPMRTYNWTGVPLFHLLKLAGMQPGAKEVVFHAEDGFSSSITIDVALHPTTLLALKANGTILRYDDGYFTTGLVGGYPYKAVIPCRYGYKWVGWIDEIEVVDYDYRGIYEGMGYSDDAYISGCVGLPMTHPEYASFNITWQNIYELTIFSNVTLLNTDFNDTTKRVYLDITNYGSDNYLHLIIPKRLLTMNYSIMVNGISTSYETIEGEKNFLIYFTLGHGMNFVEVSGMLLADVTGFMKGVPDGIVNMRDVGAIARIYSVKTGDTDYISKYDLNNDLKIDMEDVHIVIRNFGNTR
ncbi:MAG: molybdopterin-dependent oxidoreductase [Candidatus Bathyarchaeota archaeon]